MSNALALALVTFSTLSETLPNAELPLSPFKSSVNVASTSCASKLGPSWKLDGVTVGLSLADTEGAVNDTERLVFVGGWRGGV